MARHFVITADGGSRGNPGKAAYGAVVYENDKMVKEVGAFIGIASNNVAEYEGLIAGLKAVNEIDAAATILVKMDSKLVVEQMSGRWKVKHPDMKSLVKKVRLFTYSYYNIHYLVTLDNVLIIFKIFNLLI